MSGYSASIQALLENWDGEEIIIRRDRPTGAWIIIAVHNTCLGPATGGTRMKLYGSLEAAAEDVLKLSVGMTYKYAVANFPRGGGKAVIALPPDFDPEARDDLLRRYGSLIKELGGLYYTGPDVGTSSQDMNVIAETGSPYVFSRTPDQGGAGSSGPATALGTYCAIEAVCDYLFSNPSPSGRRIVVQGTGSVGQPLLEMLREAKADIAFSDVDEERIRYFRDKLGLEFIPPEAVYDAECDIFSPCALGGILTEETIGRLRCRAVVGAANNQLAQPEYSQLLHDRGIVYAPDYAVNIGGAMAITGMEAMGWSQAEADAQVRRVRQTISEILVIAREESITTEAAARRLAESRLKQAYRS